MWQYTRSETRCRPTEQYAINKALFRTTCHPPPPPLSGAYVGDDGGDGASIDLLARLLLQLVK